MNDEGMIDDDLYYLYRRRQRHLRHEEELDSMIQQCIIETDANDIMQSSSSKRSRTPRSCFQHNINLYRSPDGVLIPVGPQTSSWYYSYVEHPALHDTKFHLRFRKRFCCSYNSFLKLLKLIQEDDLFLRWENHDAAGRLPSPIELLLLGTLRYIGRGCTFDDLEENTSISQETHRQCFHIVIHWGSTTLYDAYVYYPKDKEEADLHTNEMEVAGFHGCIASTDATHISMARCPSSRANEHSAKKEALPARTYNISVNHRRQILHTTRGHPARWNDKTLALFDEFIMKVKSGSILSDYKFKLLEKMKKAIYNNNIIMVSGFYVIMGIRTGHF